VQTICVIDKKETWCNGYEIQITELLVCVINQIEITCHYILSNIPINWIAADGAWVAFF
jgi:hypothetical protein